MDPNRNPQRPSGTNTNKPPVTKTTPAQAKRTIRAAATNTPTATSSTKPSSTSTTGNPTAVSKPVPARPTTTATNNAQTSGRGTGAGAQGPPRAQPAAAAVNKNTNATGNSGQTKPTTGTAAPKKAPTFADERRILELAVQRAVLATKTVLNAPNQFKNSGAGTGPISQVQHAPAGKKSATAGKNTSSLAKDDKSPVTIADFAAQALIISGFCKAFPNYGVLGEENADELRKPENAEMVGKIWELVKNTKLTDPACERLLGKPTSLEDMVDTIDRGGSVSSAEPGKIYLIMDPVDGTSAFMKLGQYVVATGLVRDGREIMGVSAGPNINFTKVVIDGARIGEYDVEPLNLGTMISAVKGHGAIARPIGRGDLLPPVPLNRASQPAPKIDQRQAGPSKFSGLQFVDSEKSPKTLSDKVKLFAGPNYKNAIQLYSSHARYMAMALGDRSYVQIRWPNAPKAKWSIWDHVGTPLIYTESGPGKVTDMHGKALRYDEGRDMKSHWGVITADAAIHKEIVDMVKSMLGR
ncbi:uncharacterized protein B0H64DRAFT_464758 [Chaetomium fimeti]|uniref:Uncharacterized protein n=1 Tax=Chaetomium fimeti TaxID=1854472 RepID=A0AAE0HAX2_9PEZI|nr:hypothetical protein B0H64DRAFT_464758 [Chaetomium fimeti]